MFDAVTLLAFPTVVFLGIAGALIPAGRARVTTTLPSRFMPYAIGIVAIAWASMIAFDGLKLRAMHDYSLGTNDGARAAADLDPESYRVQMHAAEIQASRGNCRLAYHNARNALLLFPHSAAAQQLVARCANSDRD
jgi:hypothetical protein